MTLETLFDNLESQGFRRYNDNLRSPHNQWPWYLARAAQAGAVHCLGNDKPPQIIVRGHRMPEFQRDSVEIEICGLRHVSADWRGPWFKLKAYAITPEEAARDMPAIEAALVRAWNALNPEAEALA